MWHPRIQNCSWMLYQSVQNQLGSPLLSSSPGPFLKSVCYQCLLSYLLPVDSRSAFVLTRFLSAGFRQLLGGEKRRFSDLLLRVQMEMMPNATTMHNGPSCCQCNADAHQLDSSFRLQRSRRVLFSEQGWGMKWKCSLNGVDVLPITFHWLAAAQDFYINELLNIMSFMPVWLLPDCNIAPQLELAKQICDGCEEEQNVSGLHVVVTFNE